MNRLLEEWLLDAIRHPARFLALAVALPLSVVLLATHQVNLVLGRRQALHNLRVTAELAAGLVDQMLQQTLTLERLLAEQPGVADEIAAHDTIALAKRLSQVLALAPDADEAAVIAPEGIVLAAAPNAKLIGKDVSHHEAFTGARAVDWKPYVSQVYLREPVQAEKVVGLSVPVRDGGVIRGILQVQYRVDAIRARLQRVRVQPDGFLYVVDQEDQLVSYPFQILPGRPKIASSWPPVAHAAGSEGAALPYRDPRNGQAWLAGVYPVGDTGWRVVATQPESAVVRMIHRVVWPMGVLVAALLGLVAMMGVQWARLQATSLRLLQQNTTLLKQMQQRRTLGGGPPAPGAGEG